jgi:hypothetical protein
MILMVLGMNNVGWAKELYPVPIIVKQEKMGTKETFANPTD